MPKKIISDIIMPEKSIRQIPISGEKKHPKLPSDRLRRVRKPVNPKFVIWLIAIISVVALFFGVSMIFSSVTINVKPKIEPISFSGETFTAKLDTITAQDLTFEVLDLDKTEFKVVEATEEKLFNQKASGKIIIYNNYSSAAQRLINNTRFESTSGKIYRIATSVDVPGTKVVDGKTVPGSIEATVYADQPGEDYNLKVSDLQGDFKIPGFKGSPRYETFYARLKTDISGGLIGKQKVVSEDARLAIDTELRNLLKDKLLAELYAVKPDNYLVFPGSYFVKYENLPEEIEGSDKVKISVKGTLTSIIFNTNKFADFFARKKIADFDSLETIFIPSDNFKVDFVIKNKELLKENKTIDLKITGDASIKWHYDADSIKKSLLGQSVSKSASLLNEYKNQVTSISVKMEPAWSRYFPDKLSRIRVVELDE